MFASFSGIQYRLSYLYSFCFVLFYFSYFFIRIIMLFMLLCIVYFYLCICFFTNLFIYLIKFITTITVKRKKNIIYVFLCLSCAFVQLLCMCCVFVVKIYVLFMCCVIIDTSVHSCIINVIITFKQCNDWSKVIVLNDWTIFELIINYH